MHFIDLRCENKEPTPNKSSLRTFDIRMLERLKRIKKIAEFGAKLCSYDFCVDPSDSRRDARKRFAKQALVCLFFRLTQVQC